MAQKVDELQLQITSDASSAIDSLRNLASELESASQSAKSFVNSANSLKALANGLNKIAGVNFHNAIDGLTRLSRIDLSNLKDKKANITITVSGADRLDRLRYAASQAERDIGKSVTAMGKSLGKDLGMDSSGIASIKETLHDITHELANGGDAAEGVERLKEVISDSARVSTADLTGMREAYVNFLKDVETLRINPGEISKDEMAEWRKMGLERILKKGGARIDTDIFGFGSDFLERNSDIIDGFAMIDSSAADMFVYLREKIAEAKQALNGFTQTDEVAEKISQMAETTKAKLEEMVDVATSQRMTESADKIPIDLAIDQSRFETQIQNAINAATSKEYSTKPIKLKIDNKQLQQAFEAAFSLVDLPKLPQFADGFERISGSISLMNQSNLKDTGITQFANAFRKLVEVDTSKFDPSVFHKVAVGISEFKNVGSISADVTKFVSAMARLANAGDNTRKTAYGLDALVPRLRSAVKSFTNMGTIDSSINKFVSSFTRLATSGGKAKETAANIKELTKAVIVFLKALQHAPQVSDNLAMTIQGLGNLASAGQKTGKALSDVSSLGNSSNGVFSNAFSVAAKSATSSLKGLLNVSLQLGGKGASSLGHFMQRLGLLPGASNGIDRTAITFGNLLRAIVPFYGIRGIFDWAKEAVTVGSSLVEIENVIDTAFGDLKKGYSDISGYTYKWAKTTIDNFGVSELAAKQYAGRLMSMFNSSGFDISEGMRDSAAKMTTDLIERAGDIASFYDISVDEAMTKMQAGLAGMNRPLRSLGINLSVANLQSFALSKGINTSWKEMDQATQMALRYEYILNASQYAMGDFARTSQTYANQVRLLQLNFQSLSATIGQGLISAIAPAISWLNALIRRLIQAANVFRAFMFTLFGKAVGAAKGVANDMAGYLDDSADALGDLGSGAGGASDGLGSAGKAAKELKKQLSVLPFDELNQLAKDTDTASGGGSGGGGGGGAGGIGGIGDLGLEDLSSFDIDSSPAIQAINRWAARIREAFQKKQWANLGRIVAEGINAGFQYIYDVLDWNKLKPKVVDGFIIPFQKTINSMMHWIDWPLIGRTFARGLNDVTYTLRAWITGFNWREYGTYFAEGMNGFLDEWDAEEFGRLIADKFKAAWDFFGGWVETFHFSDLGTKLKELVTGGIDELDPWEMGKSFGKFFNGLAEMITSFLEDGSVKSDLAHAFSQFVNGFIEELDEDDIYYAMSLLKDTLFGGIKQALSELDVAGLGDTLSEVLAGLPWVEIAAIIGAKAGASLALGIFGTAFKLKAAAIIAGINVGGGATGAGAAGATGATGVASGLGAAGAAGLTVSQLSIIGGVSVAGVALGLWLKKQADESGLTKLFQLGDKDSKKKSVQSVGEGQTKNQQILNKQGMTGAGTYTSIQTVPQTPKPTASTQTVTTTLKGVTDGSFKKLLVNKEELLKDPTALKTLKGKTDGTYKTTAKDYLSVSTTSATKTAIGVVGTTFRTTKAEYNSIGTTTITKTASGAIASAFNSMKTAYNSVVSNTATKTANGVRTGAFNTAWDMFTDLKDKWVTAHLDIETNATQVVAGIANGAGGVTRQVLADIWTEYHARGGLFTGPMGFQVFGEAGAEAAIPLERKSTMKRIASAIVDSGGMATGSSSELADEIALRIAPIVMSAVTGQNERPINVNATLYTENNEVLARAVNQGNRSLDKRYNPVTQYSY